MRAPLTFQPGSIDLTGVVADAAASLRRRFGQDDPAAASAGEKDAAAVLVERLCALALEWPGDEAMRRRLVLGAVAHGALRRAQGESEATIFQDYEALRARPGLNGWHRNCRCGTWCWRITARVRGIGRRAVAR